MKSADLALRRESRFGRRLLAAFSAIVYLFLFSPILVVVYMSFNAGKTNVFPLSDYSLQWYGKMFANAAIWRNFQTSLLIAAVSTFITLIVSTCSAYSIVRHKYRGKSLFISLILAPMLIPAVITGISMLLYYSFLQVSSSIVTVIIGHVVLCIPYATLIITARLQGFDICLEEAARGLGARERTVFFRIVMPYLMPGLIGGALFSFTISMDEFALTFFINSQNSQTLPIRIWSMLRFGITPELNALSTFILFISLALITLASVLLSRKNK